MFNTKHGSLRCMRSKIIEMFTEDIKSEDDIEV